MRGQACSVVEKRLRHADMGLFEINISLLPEMDGIMLSGDDFLLRGHAAVVFLLLLKNDDFYRPLFRCGKMPFHAMDKAIFSLLRRSYEYGFTLLLRGLLVSFLARIASRASWRACA